MDLDAELAKLQEEARRELAARERARAEELEAAPQAGGEGADTLPSVPWPEGLAQADEAVRRVRDLRRGLEALDGKAEQARALPLPAKLALAAGGIVAIVAAWRLVIEPLLSIALSVAVLGLIAYGLYRLFGPAPGEDGEREP